MKKLFFVTLLVVLSMGSMYAAGNFSIAFTANFLGPADNDFKDLYGSGLFYPQLELNYDINDHLFAWAGFGILSAKGTTPVLEIETKSTQNILSLGIGYKGDFSEKFGYKIEAGAAYFAYKEEAMEIEVSDNSIGFTVNLGVIFHITQTFFAEAIAGYSLANDSITVEDETSDIKLGGVRAGVGVGITF